MTPDLTDLTNIYKNVTDAKDWPPVDIFASVMDDEAKSPKKGNNVESDNLPNNAVLLYISSYNVLRLFRPRRQISLFTPSLRLLCGLPRCL